VRLTSREVRSDGRVRWPWAAYRIRIPPGHHLKVVVGELVHEVEQSGGVLLASRPEGTGQVLEFGLEHGGRVLPVLRLDLVPEVRSGTAALAIILDDAGGSLEELERALRIGRPVALAILPGLPHSTELARRASQAGLEVLLHLPMEPEDPTKRSLMGPGGVTAEMSDEEIARIVREDLEALPGVVGVNNHMGSRGTSDARVLRAVMGVLRERGVFFVDSRTGARSLVRQVAAEVGVPTASRSVFLDSEPDPEAIRRQVLRAVEVARTHGEAIAIGHINRPHTAEVLRAMVPEIEAAGVRIVQVQTLVR
jgi:polysaccharide deacetylase 2 family uncharacterized protein YibQ